MDKEKQPEPDKGLGNAHPGAISTEQLGHSEPHPSEQTYSIATTQTGRGRRKGWWGRNVVDVSLADWIVAVATIVIACYAALQLREMRGAGEQTDKLIAAANIQVGAANRNAAAAESFSASARGIQSQTQKAVDQFRRLADNANLTIENSVRSFHQDERAWVGIGEYRIVTFNDKDEFKFVIPLVNSGKTPAILIENGAAYNFADHFVSGPPTDFRLNYSKEGSIPPQGKHQITITNSIPRDRYKDITEGRLVMYWFGQIRYHDIHTPKIHHTNFCLVYDRIEKIMAFCENGNDMD